MIDNVGKIKSSHPKVDDLLELDWSNTQPNAQPSAQPSAFKSPMVPLQNDYLTNKISSSFSHLDVSHNSAIESIMNMYPESKSTYSPLTATLDITQKIDIPIKMSKFKKLFYTDDNVDIIYCTQALDQSSSSNSKSVNDSMIAGVIIVEVIHKSTGNMLDASLSAEMNIKSNITKSYAFDNTKSLLLCSQLLLDHKEISQHSFQFDLNILFATGTVTIPSEVLLSYIFGNGIEKMAISGEFQVQVSTLLRPYVLNESSFSSILEKYSTQFSCMSLKLPVQRKLKSAFKLLSSCLNACVVEVEGASESKAISMSSKYLDDGILCCLVKYSKAHQNITIDLKCKGKDKNSSEIFLKLISNILNDVEM